MLRSLLPLLIIGLCVGLAAWLVFMWALKSGQFDDIEGPKYRMLDDDDEDKTEDKPKNGGANEDEDDSGGP
jgi:cbb3-type cytochrome oxidase maturation protein